jgi:short-subunit dehydrogenase
VFEIITVKSFEVLYTGFLQFQFVIECGERLSRVCVEIPQCMIQIEEEMLVLHSAKIAYIRHLCIVMNIVITGASKGIGKAIAEKFAAGGYSLFLCARHEETLTAVAKEIAGKNPGISVHHKTCDVASKEEVRAFADFVLQTDGHADILVNNAGAFFPGHVFEEEEGLLEEMMQTNVYSAYHLSRYLLPGMMQRRQGHIFNICSIASLQAYDHGGSYSITKYALDGLSANLRHEMKNYGVKVTSVYPGAAYTDSWSGSGVAPERIMTAEDIAEMIFTSAHLSAQACVEEIVIRPQLGDL